jgi:putative endonuclease
MDKTWYVYILECGDGTLYTGITDDVLRRLRAHETGKGAKYTRGRGPLKLRYHEICESYSHALRREIEIKRMKRQDKLNLLESLPNLNN